MKATDEEVLAAVDGEMCAQQAEKLLIIRSHMDSLELCKLNLESLILATAEKYLPQLNLVMTVPGIRSVAAIGIISEIGVDTLEADNGMLDYKDIIIEHYGVGLSGREIAKQLCASKSGINDFLTAFEKSRTLSFSLPERITNYAIVNHVYIDS